MSSSLSLQPSAGRNEKNPLFSFEFYQITDSLTAKSNFSVSVAQVHRYFSLNCWIILTEEENRPSVLILEY